MTATAMFIDDFDDWQDLPLNMKVCLYGAGEAGRNVKLFIEKYRKDIEVLCFLDSSKTGDKDGLEIVNLYEFMARRVTFDYIMITSGATNKIVYSLQKHGISNYLIIDPFYFGKDAIFDGLAFSERMKLFRREKTISLADIDGLPDIDLHFSATSYTPDGYTFNIFDFCKRIINRWHIPFIAGAGISKYLKKRLSREQLPWGYSYKIYIKVFMKPHVCQISRHGILFSAAWSGFANYIIDTINGQFTVFPDSYDDDLMVYSASGDFTSNHEHIYFARWPLADTIDIILGRRESVRCQVGKLRLSDLSVEIVYEFDYQEDIHQVACSSDDRYLVFTSFKQNIPVSNVPYPQVPIEQDPDGYRRTHEGGLKLEKMVTIDLQTKRHWFTEIPTPAPAHFECDPDDPTLFYVSAHNLVTIGAPTPILEGPGVLYKMRIKDGETIIEDSYTDKDFLRIFQHMPFRYKNRTYLAVCTTPNKLDIIDAETMTLWRRIILYEAEPPDFSITGNVHSPFDSKEYLSVNPSRDGRYIVLGSNTDFCIYDVENDLMLEQKITLPPEPAGFGVIGHTRTAGF